jgi:hypothetical protein
MTRYFIAAAAFLVINSFSCKKEPAFMAKGIITGYDMRMCPCCGGLMLTFTDKTKPYEGDFFLVDNKEQ